MLMHIIIVITNTIQIPVVFRFGLHLQGGKYWKKLCHTELPREFMIRSLIGYHTLVGEKRRRAYQPFIDTIPKNMKKYTWKDVYTSVHNLIGKLKSNPINVRILTEVQNSLKNEVKLSFKERASCHNPMTGTTSWGSVLIHHQIPCSTSFQQQHVHVFEDMSLHRRGIKLVGHGERIRKVRRMILPIGTKPSDFPGSALPKPHTILIFITNLRVICVPTHEGKKKSISIELPRHLAHFSSDSTFLAIKE